MADEQLPMKVSAAERAVAKAKTIEERTDLDKKIAVVRKIAKKIGADKEAQDRLAAAALDNLANVHEDLDALREQGKLGQGRPRKSQSKNDFFTYDDLGLTPARVQWADELGPWRRGAPEEYEEFKLQHIKSDKKYLTPTAGYKAAKNWRLDKMRSEAEYEPVSVPGADLINADFKEVMTQMEPESVHLIFTDPPYHDEFAPEYEEMARLAARVLIPGGSLITYFGHNSAPVVLPRMAQHLRFWWLCGVRHTGGRKTLPGKNVRVHWKPLAWYVKEGRATSDHVDDLIGGDVGEKERHEWAQGEGEAAYFIRMLTEPENIVMDPFMGSGTTGVAALNLHREFVGVEKDKDRWNKAAERLQNR